MDNQATKTVKVETEVDGQGKTRGNSQSREKNWACRCDKEEVCNFYSHYDGFLGKQHLREMIAGSKRRKIKLISRKETVNQDKNEINRAAEP